MGLVVGTRHSKMMTVFNLPEAGQEMHVEAVFFPKLRRRFEPARALKRFVSTPKVSQEVSRAVSVRQGFQLAFVMRIALVLVDGLHE